MTLEKKYDNRIMSLGAERDVPLRGMNSLRMDVRAAYLLRIRSVAQLRELINSRCLGQRRFVILGGGSNVLLSGDIDGVVLKIELAGIRMDRETGDRVELQIAAGEDWPALVERVVHQGLGGIENLALVPGTAGAAPIQNIACYGHNLVDTLVSVQGLHLDSGEHRTFAAEECELGYRDSIFKHALKNRFIITAISLRLDKVPVLNTHYRSRYESVEDELARIATRPYRVQDVFQAVCNIRRRKLPDIETVGSAGSIFKNPIVSRSEYRALAKTCPGLHYYPVEHLDYSRLDRDREEIPERVKIPAAWLIDNMGWGGKRVGDCGIWPTQPLNIVNYGQASPRELIEFIESVKDEVFRSFGIRLENEVVRY